jgi:hypothetical protein
MALLFRHQFSSSSTFNRLRSTLCRSLVSSHHSGNCCVCMMIHTRKSDMAKFMPSSRCLRYIKLCETPRFLIMRKCLLKPYHAMRENVMNVGEISAPREIMFARKCLRTSSVLRFFHHLRQPHTPIKSFKSNLIVMARVRESLPTRSVPREIDIISS